VILARLPRSPSRGARGAWAPHSSGTASALDVGVRPQGCWSDGLWRPANSLPRLAEHGGGGMARGGAGAQTAGHKGDGHGPEPETPGMNSCPPHAHPSPAVPSTGTVGSKGRVLLAVLPTQACGLFLRWAPRAPGVGGRKGRLGREEAPSPPALPASLGRGTSASTVAGEGRGPGALLGSAPCGRAPSQWSAAPRATWTCWMLLGLVGLFFVVAWILTSFFVFFLFCDFFFCFFVFCFCPSWSKKETVEAFTTTETERQDLQFHRSNGRRAVRTDGAPGGEGGCRGPGPPSSPSPPPGLSPRPSFREPVVLHELN